MIAHTAILSFCGIGQVRQSRPVELPEKEEVFASMLRTSAQRDSIAYMLFLLPALLVFSVFVIAPLIVCVGESFTDYTIGQPISFVGLSNYISAFKDSIFQAGMGFTLLYTFVTTVVITVLALILAIVFSKPCYTSGIQRVIFYFPSCISLMVAGYAWRYLLASDSEGLVNIILGLVGIDNVCWLSDPTAARFSVFMVAVWMDLGWCGVLFLGYIQSIPEDLYEVARLEGANQFQQAIHITIPMIMPSITINLTVLLAQGLKVYELPQSLTKAGPANATLTITHALLSRGVTEWRFGLASAFGVIILIMTSVLCFLQIRLTERYEVK